ncbi:hypothetical protein ACTS9T_06375 [Empedobacter falsenii]
MKNLIKFISILLIIFIIDSCTENSVDKMDNIDQPSINSSDTVEVSLRLGGEIKLDQEPMNQYKKNNSNDLYGLNISNNDGYYAYVYFDNPETVNLKLIKDKTYSFELIYIPEGKSKVYKHPEGHYGNPFESLFTESPINGALNEVIYSTKGKLDMFEYGATQGVNIKDYRIQSNLFNKIERYQGKLTNFTASENNKTITIDLYRMMVGVKIIANDFTEGQIKFFSSYGIIYTLEPSKNSSTNSLDIVVELPNYPVKYNNEEFSVNPLNITYTNKDGKSFPLYTNQSFRYKRLTKHVFTLSVQDSRQNSDVKINLKDEPNGILTEENVNTN